MEGRKFVGPMVVFRLVLSVGDISSGPDKCNSQFRFAMLILAMRCITIKSSPFPNLINVSCL